MTTRAHLITRTAAALAVAGAGFLSSSCTSAVTDSKSNSYLIIDRLAAAPGGADDEPETKLQSDVLTQGSVFEDVGVVTFRLAMKDPGTSTSPSVPTPNNFITVSRYRVVYSRTDGRNTPGVDVPHPFDGALTVTVGDSSATATFALVRVQAKSEPPLRNLIGNFGQGLISAIADVTFYGHDQTGRAVSVAGKISIDFADWGDPE